MNSLTLEKPAIEEEDVIAKKTLEEEEEEDDDDDDDVVFSRVKFTCLESGPVDLTSEDSDTQLDEDDLSLPEINFGDDVSEYEDEETVEFHRVYKYCKGRYYGPDDTLPKGFVWSSYIPGMDAKDFIIPMYCSICHLHCEHWTNQCPRKSEALARRGRV